MVTLFTPTCTRNLGILFFIWIGICLLVTTILAKFTDDMFTELGGKNFTYLGNLSVRGHILLKRGL